MAPLSHRSGRSLQGASWGGGSQRHPCQGHALAQFDVTKSNTDDDKGDEIKHDVCRQHLIERELRLFDPAPLG